MDELYYLLDDLRIIQSIATMGTLFVILMIALAIAAYLYAGYILMCIGRKTEKCPNNDWMAYVPVARNLYALKMNDRPWWYVFFSSTGYACASVLFLLLSLIGLGIVGTIIAALYSLFVLVVTLYVWANIYNGFGFKKLIVFCGFLPILDILIAFSSRIEFNGVSRIGSKQSGALIGTCGIYAGQEFPIDDGCDVALGRDPGRCSIVYPENSGNVSRRHCVVRYYADTHTYGVTDYSKNGTLVNGNRLATGVEREFPAGSILAFGEGTEGFRMK